MSTSQLDCNRQSNNTSENSLLTAALQYAEEGYRVFPMHRPSDNGCSCGKADCSSAGKHPRTRNGFNDASADEHQIRSWWAKYPLANIGIATGSASKLLVIDVDGHNGGDGSFDTLLAETGERWPETLTISTGGGFHYWFQYPDTDIKSAAHVLGQGIDVRAEKGCVVAPPSLHRCGRRYEVVGENLPLAPVPDWLLQRMLDAEDGRRRHHDECGLIPIGNRNNALTSIAGKLRRAGFSENEMLARLEEENGRCVEPLGLSDLSAICHSVGRYPVPRHAASSTRHAGSDNPLYWFSFNLRNWNENINIACMTAEQRGWYISLLVYAWPNRGTLPADMSVLWKLAGAESAERFAQHGRLVLAQFDFDDSDFLPVLVHHELFAQYAEKSASWEQKRLAGLASAEARKGSKKGAEASDE